MKKKKILLTLGIAAMMGLAGCGETPTDPQTPVDPPVVVVDPVVTGITLKAEGDKTAMDIGTTLKFTATVTGEGDFNKQYTFSVDKEDIATISNEGVLTAKAEGSVVVTATAAGDTTKKSSITITVNEVAVCEIKDIVKNQRKHVVGKITALTTRGLVIDDGTGAVLVYLNAAPEGYAIGDVLSVAGKVAEYHNNLQFPKDSIVKKTESTIETTTIATPTAVTAASYDEMAETIKALTPISFTATAYELESGDKKYTAFKVDDGSTHIIEPTDLPDSFSVAIGTLYNVTGYVAPYYTSSSSGSSYASFYLTAIAPKPIPVTSITVTAAGGATSVGLNETLQMSVTIAPEKATNKNVTWSVDKEGVATIDENGLLTGKTAGTVVVTATAKDGSGVSGTKSIEVLQFKDPVVSLTLGDAPSEFVLGDYEKVDVTVTVVGESATSNFNPGYSATSSDPEVATVEATDTGIKIVPVAAGTVTITVKTSGTNADGEQITKTISLEILGEPRVKTMTVAEAKARRPEDPSADYSFSSQLVQVTGIFNTYQSGSNYYNYLVDEEGNAIQLNASYTDGTHTYNVSTKTYSFTKDSNDPNRTSVAAGRNALQGKQVTVKGIMKWAVLSGRVAVQINDSVYSSVGAEVVKPTFTKAVTGQGSFDLNTTENTAYDDEVTLENITPADGYVVGSVQVHYGFRIVNLTKDGGGNYKFNAKTANKVVVNFVKEGELATLSAAQAVARATSDEMSVYLYNTPYTEYVKVTGTLVSFDLSKNNYVLKDATDEAKTITIFGAQAVTDELEAGHLGIGYSLTVVAQIENFNGTPELVNVVSASAVQGSVTTYTLTKAGEENGSISIKDSGDNEVTQVAPGELVTVKLTPAANYSSDGLTVSANSVIVSHPDDNTYTVKVYGNTTFTATFVEKGAAQVLNATLKYPKDAATTNFDTPSEGNTSTTIGGNSAATTCGLDSTIFTVTALKNHATYWVGCNKAGDLRLYSCKDDPNKGDGSALTVSASGYTIQSITITYTGASYNGGTVYGPDGSTVLTEVNGAYAVNGSSFTVKNCKESADQVRISQIAIAYVQNP